MSAKREIYKGKARIINIGAEEIHPKLLEKLPERDREVAFNLVYDCETMDGQGQRFDVKVEISHRELSGKALEWNRREDGRTPTQLDIAVKDLVKQNLLPKGATEADIATAMADANIGREVFISVTEDPIPDKPGEYYQPRARFVSPYTRLTGSAATDRLTAFLTGKPAPMVQEGPAAPSGGVPAPADDNDIPF